LKGAASAPTDPASIDMIGLSQVGVGGVEQLTPAKKARKEQITLRYSDQ